MPVVARLATIADVPQLVRLRAVMYESMGVDASAPEWQARCAAHLAAGLADSKIVGAVVDAPEPATSDPAKPSLLAASALAEIGWAIPSPTRPRGPRAHVSSVSTDLRWRRQGFARAAMTLLVAALRDRGVQLVELHATPDGMPLYESFGFIPRPGGTEMRAEL